MERISSKYDRPTIWWGDGGCYRRALPDSELRDVSSVLIHASCNLDAVTIHDSRGGEQYGPGIFVDECACHSAWT